MAAPVPATVAVTDDAALYCKIVIKTHNFHFFFLICQTVAADVLAYNVVYLKLKNLLEMYFKTVVKCIHNPTNAHIRFYKYIFIVYLTPNTTKIHQTLQTFLVLKIN